MNCPESVASSNVNRMIDSSRRFPSRVFVEGWDAFFFFDADWMFDAQFADRINELLTIEGGSCGCMVDLDAAKNKVPALVFINRETSPESFSSLLRGSGVGDGWLYGMSRFGCASDNGDWCIYCERQNEIAVIGIRGDCTLENCQAVLSRLRAATINDAVAEPLSYGFSPIALSSDWRCKLVKQYG